MALSSVLRVVSYARFSTEDQNPRSSADQHANVRKYLENMGIARSQIVEISDDGVSGEILDRTGITRVRKMIEAREFDLLVAEEVSRLFRDRSEPHKLAGECVDQGIRMLTLDGVDTQTERWQSDLSRLGEHCSTANEETSRRIKRATKGRWASGYAVGPVRPGYRHVPLDVARWERFRKGPFALEVDEQFQETIREAFRKVSLHCSLKAVAAFLDERGLPKYSNSTDKTWRDRNVLCLIKNPIYCGREPFGKTRQVKHFGSGKHLAERQPDDQIEYREVPKLAIVSPELWDLANQAIASRDRHCQRPRGRANSQFRVARSSRTFISQHAICGICGGKIYGAGNAGGFRCSNGMRNSGCWNRVLVPRKLTQQRITDCVSTHLQKMDGIVEAGLTACRELQKTEKSTSAQLSELDRELAQIAGDCQKLGKMVLDHKDVETLVDMLRANEARKAQVNREIENLKKFSARSLANLSEADVRDHFSKFVDKALESQDYASILKGLTSPIKFVPFRRIDSAQIVMRAQFSVLYVPLMPAEWRVALQQHDVSVDNARLCSTPVEVDLFERPAWVVHAMDVWQSYQQNSEKCSEWRKRTMARLGIARHTLYESLRFGRTMASRGLTDAYEEVKARPERVSRWKKRVQMS